VCRYAEVPPLSAEANQFLEDFLANFCPADAAEVKKIERTTNHDVKAGLSGLYKLNPVDP
jgi:adenylosuccinate lyase